jgi:hypothetical protein
MAGHFHDAGDLISRDDTPSFALCSNLVSHSILLSLEYRCLMQTDRGRVDAHVGENDVGIRDSMWQSKAARQRQRYVEKNIIICPMPFPEFAIQIIVLILGIGPM